MWHSFEKGGAMQLSQRQRAQWRTEKSAGHYFRYDVLIQPSDIRPAEHPVIVMSLSDHSRTPEWIKRSRLEIRAHTLTRTLQVKPSGCQDRGDKNIWTDSKSGGTTSIITLFWSISRATLMQSEQIFLLSTPLKRQTYLLNITYDKQFLQFLVPLRHFLWQILLYYHTLSSKQNQCLHDCERTFPLWLHFIKVWCSYTLAFWNSTLELRVRTTENWPTAVQEQWGNTFREWTVVQWVPLLTYVRTQMCFSVILKWQNQFISARFLRAIGNLDSF